MPLPAEVIEAVAIADVKNLGEAPALAAAISSHNAVHAQSNYFAHSNRVNGMLEAAMARSIDLLQNVGPIEARSASQVATGHDVASQIAQMQASIAAGQQSAKTAQTTPPPTA